MRKLLAIIAISLTALAVSCTREQEFSSSDGPVRVSYTIDGPAQVVTKTMGTIGSSYTLYYEVRLWDGSALGEPLTGTGLSGNKTVGAAQWPASVNFELARGKQYKILFWAQIASDPSDPSVPSGLFNATDLTAVTIDYDKMAANNENCDAFFGSDVITPSGATAASVTLQRPFALVNLGTSDAAQFHTASGGCTVGDVKVTVSGSLTNSFNVATGKAGAGVEVNFAPNAVPVDAYDAATLSVNSTDYNYLSAVYVLPPEAGSGLVDLAYVVKDNTNAILNSLEVTNVPVQTNYRTNITGKLLTGSTIYNITVDQAFGGNTVKAVCPTFASIAALNTFFASKIATGPNDPDHGDIYPESVTVTDIPVGDETTITLPNDTLSVAITILDSYSDAAGLTIAYPTVEGAKHSNKVFFNMSGLSKLTANLPDTHLEIVSGSNIDISDVHTSAGTFVVQKNARVGMLNINQGNAEIAGAVENLYVIKNATSDGEAKGESNAVQVFLSSESAVEKIHLASRSDVVVEQPKDQIEVEETQKKVAVYVNEFADNSTAKAQNGGVIYVEANVPCTVTADGVSTADEGTVSSTVIINSGAADSEVVATNGGSIDLTANANCAVVAEGSSTNPDTSETTNSTVTIDAVEQDVTVVTDSSDGGVVEPGEDAVIPEGAIVELQNCVLYTPGINPLFSSAQPDVEYPDSPWNYEVKFNGNTLFLVLNRIEVNPVACSFKNAVFDAKPGQIIRLTDDVTVGSLKIPAEVSIDFAGHKLTATSLSCSDANGKFILKQSDHSNPYNLSFEGKLQGAEIRGGSYMFDPTDMTPNGVGVVIPGEGEYTGGYYVPAVPEPKVFYASPDLVDLLGGLTIGRIPGTYQYNGWVVMYNPDGQRCNPYNTIGIQNGIYVFQADYSENEYTTQCYEEWYADYVIYYDKTVDYDHSHNCPTVGLWGSYGGMTYAILLGENVPAEYKWPMLGLVNWGWEYSRIRSDVKTFLCGPTNHSEANEGTIATVELRLYKKQPTMEQINASGFKDYITVGRYVHPLDDPSLTPGTDGN